jgi:hypothetical protein
MPNTVRLTATGSPPVPDVVTDVARQPIRLADIVRRCPRASRGFTGGHR